MKLAPRIIVQLVHIHGPLMGTIQEFNLPQIDIGRHPSCHISFPKEVAVISRRHASIKRDGNRFEIIDSSTNGTFLNGKRVSHGFLKDGDVLMFTEGGPKISFLTRIEEGKLPAPDPPIPALAPQAAPIVSPQAYMNASSVASPYVAPADHFSNQAGQVHVEVVMAPLVIQYGPMLQSFKQVPVTLGKGPDCTVNLDHHLVLGKHAQIFFSQNNYWVKDLTGRNQVLINNNPVGIQSPLSPEDRLSLTAQGPTFRFLAGGRLLECENPQPNASTSGGLESLTGDDDGKRTPKQSTSFFKKIFK